MLADRQRLMFMTGKNIINPSSDLDSVPRSTYEAFAFVLRGGYGHSQTRELSETV